MGVFHNLNENEMKNSIIPEMFNPPPPPPLTDDGKAWMHYNKIEMIRQAYYRDKKEERSNIEHFVAGFFVAIFWGACILLLK